MSRCGRVLGCLAIGWACLPPVARAGGGEADAAAEVEAMGGAVRRDDAREGKPVVAVWLPADVTGKELAVLERLPQMEELSLAGSRLGGAGLHQVGKLKGLRL